MSSERRRPAELSDEELAREIERRRKARKKVTVPEARPASPVSRPSDPQLLRYFANLEIAPTSSLDDVRAAYLRLSEKYSPEKYSGDPEQHRAAEELARSLRDAYQALRRALAPEDPSAAARGPGSSRP